MALEKLKIMIESGPDQFTDEVEALFNPTEITINKTAAWRLKPKPESDTSTAQFTHGEPATLSINLFFDTYEDGSSVRDHTDKIFKLTTIEEHGNLHRPPLCRIQWGSFDISDAYQCEWVLQSLNESYSLFLPDGTPVRATLTCSFKQWRGDAAEEKLLNKQSSNVPKTRTVRRGDTLSSIAAEEHNDPSLWRTIAEANGIDNPRVLKVGQVVAIPALRSVREARR